MNSLAPAHCGKKEEKHVAVMCANVSMRSFEIYRATLYNVYGGSRVSDGRTIQINKYIWIANVQLVYVGLAQARPKYIDCEHSTRLCGARSGLPQIE